MQQEGKTSGRCDQSESMTQWLQRPLGAFNSCVIAVLGGIRQNQTYIKSEGKGIFSASQRRNLSSKASSTHGLPPSSLFFPPPLPSSFIANCPCVAHSRHELSETSLLVAASQRRLLLLNSDSHKCDSSRCCSDERWRTGQAPAQPA